jgi:glycerol-3-phosphate cytidylyltransferase-like family protein
MFIFFLVHDESTFRSGEVSPKRWFFSENIPFFSKGRGRSHMVSDFLVQHPGGPFFELSEDEWKQAGGKYKTLSADTDVDYLSRTATASINIGTDAYFDNDTILSQFERLFQMLEFKQAYKDHQIDIIVDNARTHTAKAYSLQDFGKNIGTQCKVEKIEYVDENGATQVIDCYFKQGPNKGKSKGLVEICEDLGVQLPKKVKLADIHKILSKHPAFQNVSQSHFIILKIFYSI